MQLKRIAFFILLILMESVAFAQDTVMVISPALYEDVEEIYLAKLHGWYFKQGSDTAWAAKNLDMTGWKKMRPVDLSVDMADANGKVEGWFRGNIKIDSSFGDTALSLYFGVWAAQDIYIDGKKIASVGNTGSNGKPYEEKKVSSDDLIFILSDLKAGTIHKIAWHITDSRAFPFAENKLKSEVRGLRNLLEIVTPVFTKWLLEKLKFLAVIDSSINVSLSIIAFLFWLIWSVNRRERNLLHFALFSSLLASFFISYSIVYNLYFTVYHSFVFFQWKNIADTLLISLIIGYIPYLLALIFEHPLIKRLPLIILSATIIELTNVIFNVSNIVGIILLLIYIVLILFIMITSLKKAKGGDWAIIGGLLLTLLFGYLFFSFHANAYNYKSQIPYRVGFALSFPLSLLIYVAIRFREMIRDIQTNAEEVVKLSDEKRIHAEQQQELLEVQVTERTQELIDKNNELEIEAALQRVRSAANAMQTSNELLNVIKIVGQQLELLGVTFDSTNFRTNLGEKDWQLWVYAKWMDQPQKWFIPKIDHPYFSIHEKEGEVVSNVFSRAEKDSFDAYLFQLGLIETPKDPIIAAKQKEFMESANGFAWSIAAIKSVSLNIANSQAKPYTTRENALLLRFTIVFEQAYTRFLDLQKAEAQSEKAKQDLILLKEEKKRTEDALNELQITQKQLIQAEKMASLGELTAGIAHEIQNPLNFVNNFSEVSTELVDEMNEEIQKGNMEDAKQIAQDLKENLEKINHHGKRAGDIVRGMLQHSRSSSGQKEPTDINALADEYLRLAYHGLRAKDKTFNATMHTDFDESIGKINIIPQDIGRVILNLITNAFYVVDEKKKSGIENYHPTVSVSTKKLDGKILIHVKDNGNGITQKVFDKIFQPFFTTKPTGQGTGLGLSLSYDIVKAHGGEIKVETKEGVGTEFIIALPVN